MILPLDRIARDHFPRAGAKAFHCARLQQSGLPVPDGFVVTGDASGPWTEELRSALQRFSPETRFAVRSSGVDEDGSVHSFAGIYETVLNVPPSTVRSAVETCRKSAQSPRAMAYRRSQGLASAPHDIAVLVQVMIPATVSGVAFTIDPINRSADELVITASWGCGEAVVGGHVEPDEFRLRRADGSVTCRKVGSKARKIVWENGASRWEPATPEERNAATLSGEQLQVLRHLLLDVERLQGAAQDIEWCYDGSRFWILQARPATGMNAGVPDIEWTRAHFRETLPDPTAPQTLAAMCRIIDQANRRFFGGLLAPERELGPLARGFHGRLYLNLSQMRRVCLITRTPPAEMFRELGHAGEIAPEDCVPGKITPRLFLRAAPTLLRMAWWTLNLQRVMRRHFRALEERTAALNSRDPASLSDAETWAGIRMWSGAAHHGDAQKALLMAGISSCRRLLNRLCRGAVVSPETLIHSQFAIGEKTANTRQLLDLLALARAAADEENVRRYFGSAPETFPGFRDALAGTRFLERFEDFLRKYGHRGVNELDWSMPRYRENPEVILFTVREQLRLPDPPQPERLLEQQEKEAAETWRRFESGPGGARRMIRGWLVRRLLQRMKRMYLWREQERSEWIRCLAAVRHWHLALAESFVRQNRLEKRDDYFFVTFEEIDQALAGAVDSKEIRERAASRKAEQETWRPVNMPLTMRERQLPQLLRPATARAGRMTSDPLRGLCVSAGCVEGPVVRMTSPAEFARMKRGAILVAPATDPSWTPLFILAAGVIVEIGGILSHAATVAREFGLPSLANVENAMERLNEGDLIRLDATNGLIEILKPAIRKDK